MGAIRAATKNLKTSIGGAGCGGIGTVQQAGVTTAGAAFNLTAWAGREVIIRVNVEVPYRWAVSSAVTSIDTTTTSATAGSPVATGGGWLFPGMPNFRDVPFCDDPTGSEGVFLIVDPTAGTVDVHIELVG